MSAPPSSPPGANAPARGMALGAAAVALLLVFLLLEIALRLAPGLIPPNLLLLFEPGLRAGIASGAYPLQKDFRPVERDDGGPPLFVAKPDTRIVSIDEVPGGAERFTDELGFCNPHGRYEGRTSVDLVAIGDSFSWCHAVLPEEAWPARLEQKSGLAVYSLGRGGNGPYEYLQYLRAFGLAKKPRVVVLNVYGGNDLRDAAAYWSYRRAMEEGREPPSETPRPIAPALRDSVAGRHSYALNLLLAALSRIAGQDPADWERTGIDFGYEVEVGGRWHGFNPENRDRDEVVTARHLAAGTMSPSALWGDAMKRFADLAREQSFRGVVAYTPSAQVAYEGHLRFAEPGHASLLKALDDAQRDYLREVSSTLGLLFHDLTPDLRSAAAAGDLAAAPYDAVHLHLTARGNEVVAESLLHFLEANGLTK